METSVGADAVKLAGLQIDLLQKIRKGQVSLGHLEWFNNLTKEDRDILISRTVRSFKIWKTITLGTGLKNAGDFIRDFCEKGIKISEWAIDMLGNPAFTVASEKIEIDLVVVSVADLGLKNGAERKDIYARAKELGLDICPAEVGPQLRLQYNDQPSGEWIFIAMEPISGSGGNLELFVVDRDGSDLRLFSCDGYPDYFWHAGHCFVFALPRK